MILKANGIFVWDANGRKYLDFLGDYGLLNIGHNHPYVIEAINKVLHMPNLLQVSLGSISAALAYNLAIISPGNLQRTFFCNSGAEAVECALKLARIYTGKKKMKFKLV
ncbi:aminotransferase class III-fold pyridoxal phosphate-dependent enzyme [Peptococcaceae bacterium]|nr:aminotransferase class III-fold pyridoxal phosphate-dependent enzyme [Peptococcaceae bacterium]